MAEDRTTEARVRRAARRVGWRVEKSRTRILHINDRGMWQLIDDRNIVVVGDDYDATLSACAYHNEIERQRMAA